MNTIIFTVITALLMGLILGTLLGLFKKLFAVQTDPKVAEVRESLSGANCGGCGYAGCDAFASAVVKGEAPVNGCVAGGPACAQKLAMIMGITSGESKPRVAVVMCGGSRETAAFKGVYNGVKTCVAAALSVNGLKKCAFGCIGFGDCAEKCPFGAINMGDNGLPIVDYDLCVGCGRCVKVCPKHIITLLDKDTKGAFAICSCHNENRPQIKKDCSVGCIKCGICVKKCQEHCIDLESGIPKVDYAKCTSCGTCVSACPDKVFKLLSDIIPVESETGEQAATSA